MPKRKRSDSIRIRPNKAAKHRSSDSPRKNIQKLRSFILGKDTLLESPKMRFMKTDGIINTESDKMDEMGCTEQYGMAQLLDQQPQIPITRAIKTKHGILCLNHCHLHPYTAAEHTATSHLHPQHGALHYQILSFHHCIGSVSG